MKNYLKFVVAVFGITIATFGSISTNARVDASGGHCRGTGDCGCTPSNQDIIGTYK